MQGPCVWLGDLTRTSSRGTTTRTKENGLHPVQKRLSREAAEMHTESMQPTNAATESAAAWGFFLQSAKLARAFVPQKSSR